MPALLACFCIAALNCVVLLAGQHGNTLVDLRARHTTSEMTYVPHEVKAPWAEKHNGRHFADLLRHEETRPTVARPSAQILSYMVCSVAMAARLQLLMSSCHL